ncbi:MAG: UDP-glucose 4-epimerase GalE [Candidatus Daviesbacteria bacterium]|nr:UDP-glucose 4-epimerase GalE [Candidatus Daviesbacteria bacterium]
MKVLVTGAGGYIGSNTSYLLLQNNFEIVALDNFSKGYREPLGFLEKKFGKKKFVWEEIDLVSGNLDLFLKKHKVDAILHFAALCNVGESWEDPTKYFSNNIIGLQRLAASAIKNNIKNIVFSSTCAVYGDAQYIPIDENHPLVIPSSPYGASKKICEEILGWYSKMDLLKYVFLRYFNVTGASDDGQIGDSKNPSFHLIQNALRGALGIEKFELNYAPVNTPDGSPIRDYVNVIDLARAHMLALNYLVGKKGESNIFNLGTGIGNSVLEIIKIVKEKTGVDFPVSMSANRRKGEADKMIADITKAKKVLDWKPNHTLEQSIDSLLIWYKSHPQGW